MIPYEYTPKTPADIKKMMDELRRLRSVDKRNQQLEREVRSLRNQLREATTPSK